MAADKAPPGLELRHTLTGHKNAIYSLAWSPDGQLLASAGSRDRRIILWEPGSGSAVRRLSTRGGRTFDLSWAPDGVALAAVSENGAIHVMDVVTGESRDIKGHAGWATAVAWHPTADLLASLGHDGLVKLSRPSTSELVGQFPIGDRSYYEGGSLVWAPDGGSLAAGLGSSVTVIRVVSGEAGVHGDVEQLSGATAVTAASGMAWTPDGARLLIGNEAAIFVFDMTSGTLDTVLEGHTAIIHALAVSADGSLIASKSEREVCLWSSATWQQLATVPEFARGQWIRALAFHPREPLLASMGPRSQSVRLWELDPETLIGSGGSDEWRFYKNAKVVLVGDSGVGKTGLALVLTQRPWTPTESTHGRHVWTFENETLDVDGGHETREILLWDLAGQPGYRLVHQLSLTEVAAAVLVFDSRSEVDPLSGVRYWDRALRQAERLQGEGGQRIRRLLVAARVDRGGVAVTEDRIAAALGDESAEYFETSAKEGRQIPELRAAIHAAIDWPALPRVASSDLFHDTKEFLVAEKAAGRLLSTSDDLFRSFSPTAGGHADGSDLKAQFETCIGLVEARGLIRRLSFGKLVLLQPELIDAYASAIVSAARDEPDGLGSLPEEAARSGRFRMSLTERIQDSALERLLLIETIEDLLRHEVAFRESVASGSYLVFPSQSTRVNPDLRKPTGTQLTLSFDGSVVSIYATLVVRLSRSEIFHLREIWENAALFGSPAGGTYGCVLGDLAEGHGDLTVFFDDGAGPETRVHFEQYVRTHVERRAIPGTVQTRRLFVCDSCGTPVADIVVERRRQRDFDWLDCPVCTNRISLKEPAEELRREPPSQVPEMERRADIARERDTAGAVLDAKAAQGAFDVFLSYNRADRAEVERIAERLRRRGVRPWVDVWELRPGLPWQGALEKQISKVGAAAVFVGKDGIGPWQERETEALLNQFVARRCPVIPVVLGTVARPPGLPLFLQGMTWVDFREPDPDPLEQLEFGITGRRRQRARMLDDAA